MWAISVPFWPRAPEADVGAAGLVVGEPADRRHLQPRAGTGRVHLDVEAAMVALAEVTGADLDRVVGQLERGDGALGARQQLVEHRGRLLGRGDREDLDLVELVHAQHAACVATRRARLAAVARRGRHHPHRQLRLGEDLVAVQRCQRHLGGGDGPQVVALDRERVVGELRELPRRRERGGGDERRRADLLEGVGVAVEGELAERPAHRRAEAARHREHRPADLDRPFAVEDAERGAGLPVRHSAMGGELGRQVHGSVHHRVVGVRLAVGRIGVRKVGDHQQQVTQLRARRRRARRRAPAPARRVCGSRRPAPRRRRCHRRAGAGRPAWTAR